MNVFLKKHISVILAICLVLALTVSVIACKDKNEGQPDAEETSGNTPTETTPAETTPAETTTKAPEETTTKAPEETVTYPSDAEEDPKQEDIFYQ